jgi:hypothetical protein
MFGIELHPFSMRRGVRRVWFDVVGVAVGIRLHRCMNFRPPLDDCLDVLGVDYVHKFASL